MAVIRVLILEDDDDIIDLVRSVLEPDFECITASNGLKGLQMALEGQPDLIVCDIMMPVLDGREFVKRLRQQPGLGNLPVIFLSALSSREQIRDGYQLGAALYLTKPIDPKRFRRNIEIFIKDHGVAALPKKKSVEELREVLRPVNATPPPPTRESQKAASGEDKKPLSATPRARGHYDPELARAMARKRQVDGPARVRLLIVDDDRDTMMMLRNGLENDYEIVEASDGMSAIEMAVRFKPDIFLIDGMLPRMTGYQLTMMLKKNREFFRSPIVFMSGRATQRDRLYVERLGVTQFIAKPFTLEQVREVVTQLTKRPGFTIRTDRCDIRQFQLEHFQQLETHRTEASDVGEHMERAYLERVMRDQNAPH